MEKEELNESIKDVLTVYAKAKEYEHDDKLEEAIVKYKVAAEILEVIARSTGKNDKNYSEYKMLANEIVIKSEA